jgi:uncharacterized membrane protein YbhN (UPF0104 family)
VLERIFDLLVLSPSALGTRDRDVPEIIRHFTWLAGFAAGVLIVAVAIVHANRDALLPVIDKLWSVFPESVAGQIRLLEHEFLDGITTIANPRVLLIVVAWSAYIWFLIAVSFALGFLATDIQVPFLGGGVTVTTIVALAVSLPGAPGFVGQFEWGCKIALQQITVEGSAGGRVSIVTHITQFVTQVTVGLVYSCAKG